MTAHHDSNKEVLELVDRRTAFNKILKQRGLSRDKKISLLNTKDALLQQIRNNTKVRNDLEEGTTQLKNDPMSARHHKMKLLKIIKSLSNTNQKSALKM